MSLADTCDELEEALAAVSGPQTYGRYLRALVKLGDEQREHAATAATLHLNMLLSQNEAASHVAPGFDIPGEQRFEELKKRVEGL